MNILATNDDGIHAPGLLAVARFFSSLNHQVTVVAPKNEMSAVSHAITMHEPIRIIKLPPMESFDRYAVNGTPADCVKVALDVILETKPDWVLSGINSGLNLGTDVLYSGTVSAAMEGLLHGIPSMALSAPVTSDPEYSHILNRLHESIFKQLSARKLKGLFNINFPNFTPTGPVQVTELGALRYRNIFKERTDPRGNLYYWLAGEPVETENDSTSDISAIEMGAISLSPIRIDLTDRSGMEALKNLF